MDDSTRLIVVGILFVPAALLVFTTGNVHSAIIGEVSENSTRELKSEQAGR